MSVCGALSIARANSPVLASFFIPFSIMGNDSCLINTYDGEKHFLLANKHFQTITINDVHYPFPLRSTGEDVIKRLVLALLLFIFKALATASPLTQEADITLVDLAMFGGEEYEVQLAIAYILLNNHIHTLGERDQHLARPIINISDEEHTITFNPLLARFLTKVSKMWHKLGNWLWLATHNLNVFRVMRKSYSI